jgi:hypothetical protein
VSVTETTLTSLSDVLSRIWAAFLASWLIVALGTADARAQSSTVATAEASALTCIGGVESVVSGPGDTRVDPTAVEVQEAFSGTPCTGGTDNATASARADLTTASVGVFASVLNPDLVAAGRLPEATAGAAFTDSFVVRNNSPSSTLRLRVKVNGFVGAGSPCDPTPLGSTPCVDAYFLPSVVPIILPDGTRVPLGQVAKLRGGETLLLEYPVGPGENILLVTNTLGSQVEIQGLVSLHGTAILYLELPESVEFLGSGSGVLGSARSDFVLRPGQAIPDPAGSLHISPATGTYLTTQAFDIELVAQTAGQGIVGGAVTLDGVDVTAPLAGCLAAHVGALSLGTPAVVARCPGLTAGALGAGSHTLAARLDLSGGGSLSDAATWDVVPTTE